MENICILLLPFLECLVIGSLIRSHIMPFFTHQIDRDQNLDKTLCWQVWENTYVAGRSVNWYFLGGNLENVYQKTKMHIPSDPAILLQGISPSGTLRM